MKITKLIIIKIAEASNPNKEPVFPVRTDFTESRSMVPKMVLPTNIMILKKMAVLYCS